MANTLALRIYASDRTGNLSADHLLVSRNFRETDREKAVEHAERVRRVYEQKVNRGDDPSYRLVLQLQDRKGLKGMTVLEVLEDVRLFHVSHGHG